MRRACFIDRDGVIVALLPDGYSVRSADQVELCAGAAEGIGQLQAAGLLAIVVTNQPGPATGQYSRQSVLDSNTRMHALLAEQGITVDALYVCMHHPTGGPAGEPSLIGPCECRKPKPGMLLAGARDHGIDLGRSFMIGDRETDVQAGIAAGCRSILIGPEVPTLLAAVQRVLGWLGKE